VSAGFAAVGDGGSRGTVASGGRATAQAQIEQARATTLTAGVTAWREDRFPGGKEPRFRDIPGDAAYRGAEGMNVDDDDDELPPQTRAPATKRAPAASPVTAIEASVRGLVDEGGIVLVEGANVKALAERLLAHLETLDTVDIGGAISEWLIEQDEIDELYADDLRIVAAMRKSLAR